MPDTSVKYMVALAPISLSFYDPLSGANLFKAKPTYGFNHLITRAIYIGVKYGKILDLRGNIIADYEAMQAGGGVGPDNDGSVTMITADGEDAVLITAADAGEAPKRTRTAKSTTGTTTA